MESPTAQKLISRGELLKEFLFNSCFFKSDFPLFSAQFSRVCVAPPPPDLVSSEEAGTLLFPSQATKAAVKFQTRLQTAEALLKRELESQQGLVQELRELGARQALSSGERRHLWKHNLIHEFTPPGNVMCKAPGTVENREVPPLGAAI